MNNNPFTKIEHLLRGAAKILGCNSATLLLIDEKREQITIKIGAYNQKLPLVNEVMNFFGQIIETLTVKLFAVKDSLILKAFKNKELYETNSVRELLGSIFSPEFASALSNMVGEHRLICVPALNAGFVFGVILFEKEDPYPFTLQQRELMLRYGQKIGNAIAMQDANDLLKTGQISLTFDGQNVRLKFDESSPMIVLDSNLKVKSASHFVESLLGYEPSYLIGKPIDFLLADIGMKETLIFRTLDSDEYMIEEVIELIHKNGQKVSLSTLVFYMVDEFDKGEGFVFVFRQPDKFSKRESGFSRILRKERLAAMGEIAAQLAHEIRNPLISIGSMIDVLKRENEGNPELRESLNTIAIELARMDAIITDYLSLAAKYGVVVRTVQIEDLVREAVKLARQHKAAISKEIVYQVETDLTAKVDYNGIKQVLFNLLLNALEASEAHSQVTCTASSDNGRMMIRVEDNGHGLPDKIDDLFEPFFTTKENGTGLGLSVCKRILEAHGGAIRLENKPTGGTSAIIYIPHKPKAGIEPC